jgi:hypothetical protein
MAKSTKTISKEDRLVKSLTAAAKVLNKKMHLPDLNIAADNVDGDPDLKVKLYQVWCPDEEKVIGEPTTDYSKAERERNRHNDDEGHLSRILISK